MSRDKKNRADYDYEVFFIFRSLKFRKIWFLTKRSLSQDLDCDLSSLVTNGVVSEGRNGIFFTGGGTTYTLEAAFGQTVVVIELIIYHIILSLS
jgi:hypothetical protein